jgi:predicted phosphodiesterase
VSLFRLIHISDFHYCVRPHRRNFFNAGYSFFRELPALTLRHFAPVRNYGFFPSSYSDEISEIGAKFIYDFNREFDLLVASGDIATIGTQGSIEAAYEFVAAPYRTAYLTAKQAPTLGGIKNRIFLLPGNHDRYQNLLGATGGRHFDEAFKKYWPQNDSVSSRVLGKNGDIVALIAGDFSLQSDDDAYGLNRLGRGKAYQGVIDKMVAKTIELREKYAGAVLIWVVHFPPAQVQDAKLLLIDDHLLEGAAIKTDISLILAGHLHQNRVMQTQYGTPILAAGSFCSYDGDGNNWTHVINLEISKNKIQLCEKIDYRWDDAAQDFIGSGATRIAT